MRAAEEENKAPESVEAREIWTMIVAAVKQKETKITIRIEKLGEDVIKQLLNGRKRVAFVYNDKNQFKHCRIEWD